jgi:signal transduction histidine kinase
VTADSLSPLTAAVLEVGPQPAVDAQLIADLLLNKERSAPAARTGHPRRFDLDACERTFGRQIRDERVRSSVIAARARAERLVEAGGRLNEPILYSFAADVFVSLAVERPWRLPDAEQLVGAIARGLGSSTDEVAAQLLVTALRAPQLLELPPTIALDVQLSLLPVLTPVTAASIWVRGEDGRPDCILTLGESAATRRSRAVALRALEGQIDESDRGLIVGMAIRRWQAPWGALVVRVPSRDMVETVLEEACSAISPIVEREFLLQRSAEREQALVKASERRLSRLGFDLHDGALQQIAALTADVRRLRPALGESSADDVSSIESQLGELDRVLRELAHSLEPASLLRRPIERVVEAEIEGLKKRTGIEVQARIFGDFGAMTQSQKIALIRVAQEAFTNIREHSNATSVELLLTGSRSCVELQIVDDGDGFEVTRTLQQAAQRGRLGLVGSSERMRLLGGTFDIRSKPGGPTTVSVTLPRWQPLSSTNESGLQLAF